MQENTQLAKGKNPQPARIYSDLKVPSHNICLLRASLLRRMQQTLQLPGLQTVILVGIGGSGKTTLARTYAKQNVSPLVWEINASSDKSLLQSFQELAFELAVTLQDKSSLSFIQQIQREDERIKQVVMFVRSKLRSYGSWLLIFDNLEDWAKIKSYLPHDAQSWGEGKVIITSQDNNAAYTRGADNICVIDIGVLDEEESYVLFKRIRGDTSQRVLPPSVQEVEESEIRAFLARLPPFPLDVTTAAYYLKDTSLSYEDYTNKITQGCAYFDSTQEQLIKENTHYNQTRCRLIQLAFQRIMENNPEFKILLWMVCYVDSQHIPKKLLTCLSEPVVVANFLRKLHQYSFITGEHIKGDKSPEDTFSMHRSVQEFGRIYLWQYEIDKTAILDKVRQAVHSFYTFYVDSEPLTLRMAIPHLESLLNLLSTLALPQSFKDSYMQDLLLTLGYAHKRTFRSPLLERQYFSEAYHLQLHTHHFGDSTVAKLLQDLASVCADLEYADETTIYIQESIRLWQSLPGNEISLAETWRLLGYSYIYKNDFDKARECCEKALQTIENIEKSRDVAELKARIYAKLAWIYSVTYITGDKIQPAKEFIHQALQLVGEDKVVSEEQRNSLADMSVEVARHKVGLGDIYCRSGDYAEAMIQGFGDALYIINHPTYKHTHGLMHVYMAIGLGEIYLRTGRLREAQACLGDAIKDIDRISGSRNSLSLSSHIFYAETCIRLGELDKAYDHCLAVFDIDKKDNTNYSNLMRHLAHYHAGLIQYKKGNVEQALSHLKTFIILMKDFGSRFFEPSMYASLQDYFDVSTEAGDCLKDIKRYIHQSASLLKAIYGFPHPFIQDFVVPNEKVS